MMSATTPQTASTTTDDASESGLPAFTTFQATELETSWDYYERAVSHQSADLSSQANYTRPWEMETKEQQQQHQQQQLQQLQLQRGFEPFPKLPSFQSQFHTFTDGNLATEPSLPAQVTAVPVPISPSSGSPSGGSLTQLTQLTPSPLTSLQPTITTLPPSNFHTLATINVQPSRAYPLVPAPIQARDIPAIQQQYIDERHIQLYQPITTTATFHHPAPPQSHQGVVTVLKNDPMHSFELKNGSHSFSNSSLENSSFMDSSNVSQKLNNKGIHGTPTSHTPKGTRKKERRKIRASSLESSTESDASSAMDIDGNSSGNPGQVAAVSSTDNFKSPMHTGMDNGDHSTTGEKQVNIFISFLHTTWVSIQINFSLLSKSRRSGSVAVNASAVKRRTTAASVHRAVTTNRTRFASSVVVKSWRKRKWVILFIDYLPFPLKCKHRQRRKLFKVVLQHLSFWNELIRASLSTDFY